VNCCHHFECRKDELEAQLTAALAALRQARETLVKWLDECECSPDDMPPMLHGDTRDAIAAIDAVLPKEKP